MNDSEFDNFIKSKSYKYSNQFNSDPASLAKIIKYVKKLPLESRSFDILFDLLKFYRTPLFIVCMPFYERIMQDQGNNKKLFENQINQIAQFIKNYLQDFQLLQLNFFFVLGVPKKKKKTLQKSETQINFIKYMQKLGQQIRKLKKTINQLSPQMLKSQLDQILSSELDRKLNVLQYHYEQYFKSEANKLYNENLSKLQQNDAKDSDVKWLQPKPELQNQKKQPLCCRTFFHNKQIIREAENQVSQYKQYVYPFKQSHIKVLKKTVCAFLNAEGGIIYLGIQEHVDTKRRKVLGMQLSQFQKQQLASMLRKDVFSWIEPSILECNMYSIQFVPIKESKQPHHFISGRYLTKIYIKYGIRNQIYSYKHPDKDMFSFRTQNQVIHKEGRQILNAYRQRLKNPAPIPAPRYHAGPCLEPQIGNPIYEDKQDRNNDYPNYPPYFNSNDKIKRKYKEKDSMDFILIKITEKQLLKQMEKQKLLPPIIITSDQKKKLCFIKLQDLSRQGELINFLSKIESKKLCQFYETHRSLIVNQKSNKDIAIEAFTQAKIKFELNEPKKIFQFESTQQAIKAFLVLRQLGLQTNFVSI